MSKHQAQTASHEVHLQEEVVLDGVGELHAALREAASSDAVTIDARDARFIDGAGWQLLSAFFHHHVNVSFVNASEQIHAQAETLGLDKVLPLGDVVVTSDEVVDEDDLCPVF